MNNWCIKCHLYSRVRFKSKSSSYNLCSSERLSTVWKQYHAVRCVYPPFTPAIRKNIIWWTGRWELIQQDDMKMKRKWFSVYMHKRFSLLHFSVTFLLRMHPDQNRLFGQVVSEQFSTFDISNYIRSPIKSWLLFHPGIPVLLKFQSPASTSWVLWIWNNRKCPTWTLKSPEKTKSKTDSVTSGLFLFTENENI